MTIERWSIALNYLSITFLLTILLIAVFTDIKYCRIPNYLTYPSILITIIYNSFNSGFHGFIFSVSGIITGMAILLLFYIMGFMGAGDVKLMGFVGGIAGVKGILFIFLFTIYIGMFYALILLAIHGHLKETFKRYWFMLKTFLITHNFFYIYPSQKIRDIKMRHGVVIALGVICYLIIISNNINPLEIFKFNLILKR